MQHVLKFAINANYKQTVLLPLGSEILHVGLDPQGETCIWTKSHPENELFPQTLYIIGTGEAIPPAADKYIGSFRDGPFMWHVYCGSNN